MKKYFLISLALLFLVSLNSFIFAQKVELIFSHKFHQEQEIGCADCHQKASTSKLPTDNLLPDMEACFKCHDSEGECTLCHQDPDNAVDYPRITNYVAFFAHESHLKKDANCRACHVGIENDAVVNVQVQHLPQMTNCTQCHDNLEQPGYCQACHAPTEELRPSDHRIATWKLQHGVASEIALNNCTECHTPQACIACHQGDNLDHKVHRLNYQYQHGLQAKGNKTTCITCHEEASFCNDCHRTQMVMPRTHATANWTNAADGGRHARAAKLDLDACISCHSDTQADPVCIQCHQK
jgi:hypothetical protein